MDRGDYKKLNPIHVIFLVENVIIGLGLLSLPHDLSDAGYSQWIIPIIWGILSQIALIPMVQLGRLYPNDTLFSINERLLGKWVGKLMSVWILIYFFVEISTVSEGYLRLVQTVTLPQSTITLPLIVLFVTMIYITLGGIKSVARFCIVAFVITGWMVYYEQWSLSKGHFIHLMPLFDFTFQDFWAVTKDAFTAMFGFELLMIYFPYIRFPEKTLNHASIGLWIVISFYIVVTFSSTVYFTEWQMANLRFPVLNQFKAVELSFIERVENFGVSLWAFLILSTICAYLWSASKGMEVLTNKKGKGFTILAAIFPMLIILLPITHEIKQKLYYTWGTYLGISVILYPNVLLLVHLIRKGRTRHRETPHL